jgi:glycosyltransferase involved in cell wall biosynthesis
MIGKSYRMMTKKTRKSKTSSQDEPESAGRPILMFCSNTAWNLANFRGPLIASLAADGCRVIAAAAADGTEDRLLELGAEFHPLPVKASSRNPLHELRFLASIVALLRRERPSALLTFTIKANIYGTMAARLAGVRAIATVSGLGSAFLAGGVMARMIDALYKIGFARASLVFFQNADDRDLFLARRLVSAQQVRMVPGSGVDLDRFKAVDLPANERPSFLLVSRMLWDKGVGEFAEAARLLADRSSRPRFAMVGGAGVDNPSAVPTSDLKRWADNGIVEYLGTKDDVRPAIAAADCVVLPSYREGVPRSLLEAAAMGRPLIATDVPGCREVVEDGVNGFLCEPRSAQSLADAIGRMADLSADERKVMGERGRKLVESRFAVSNVVAAYRAELVI